MTRFNFQFALHILVLLLLFFPISYSPFLTLFAVDIALTILENWFLNGFRFYFCRVSQIFKNAKYKSLCELLLRVIFVLSLDFKVLRGYCSWVQTGNVYQNGIVYNFELIQVKM